MFAEKIRSLRFAQEEFPPIESDQAGALGEEIAYQKLLGVLNSLHSRTKIYRSLRVPKRSGLGKFEIDLLLVTEKAVLAIEVKHWGGRLCVDKGRWIQERRDERKTLVDPLPLHQEKMESLRVWLEGRGIKAEDAPIQGLLVFSNEKTRFDGNLKKTPGLARIHRFGEKVQKICGQPKRPFWKRKPRSHVAFSALTKALDELPTWDRLRLHGGRILHGDVVSVVVPGVAPAKIERSKISSFRVDVVRRIFPGLFLRGRIRVKNWSGRRKSYSLHPDSHIVFRSAGQAGTEEFACLHVESLNLGWKDQSFYIS